LEKTLPATFLRVHRSGLINVMFVKSLERVQPCTGTLRLIEGTDIPVSRRIMPKIRPSLTQSPRRH
jgi:DNA-binding LytR/AlgR family response regulator